MVKLNRFRGFFNPHNIHGFGNRGGSIFPAASAHTTGVAAGGGGNGGTATGHDPDHTTKKLPGATTRTTTSNVLAEPSVAKSPTQKFTPVTTASNKPSPLTTTTHSTIQSSTTSHTSNAAAQSGHAAPTPTAHPQPSHGSSGISSGALAAAIAVPIVVVFLLVILGIFLCRKKRRQNYYYDGSSTDVQEVREEPKSNFAGGAPMNFPDPTAMQDNSHLGDQRAVPNNTPHSNEPFLPPATGQHTSFGGLSGFSKEHGGHEQQEDDEVSAIDEDEEYDMPDDGEHATVGVAQRASVVPMGTATTPRDERSRGYRPG